MIIICYNMLAVYRANAVTCREREKEKEREKKRERKKRERKEREKREKREIAKFYLVLIIVHDVPVLLLASFSELKLRHIIKITSVC